MFRFQGLRVSGLGFRGFRGLELRVQSSMGRKRVELRDFLGLEV